MKDKCFILYGNPETSALSDPEIQSFEDVKRHTVIECPYLATPSQCSPPCFACVRVAGAKMAWEVIQFQPEASEETLALERDSFRRRGALPPEDVMAYVDPERGFEQITDPEKVVQRVWEHARAVLDLKPGERVPHSAGRYTPPGSDVPPALLRHAEPGANGGAPRGEMRARQPLSYPRPKVLVVEDDAALARMLRISLRAGGFDVVDVADGAEALNVLKQPGPTDALIVDVDLSNGAGRTIFESLRRIDEGDLPDCVVVSALDREEVMGRYGRFSGHFVAKPFDPWDLVHVVEKLLSERNGGRGRRTSQRAAKRETSSVAS
jgi:CheY-like chemotaxis protein